MNWDTTTRFGCATSGDQILTAPDGTEPQTLQAVKASPIAAWGYDFAPPDLAALTDISYPVAGPPQPNADYWVMVVESPYLQAAGSTSSTDSPGEDQLKLIPLEEFLTEYVGEARSYTFGVRGGAGVDESLTIMAIFNWLELNRVGAETRVIIRARKYSDPIYLNRVTTLYASNVTVEWRSPIICGAAGGLRAMGDQPEVLRNGKTFKAKLRANASAGATVLQLSTANATTNMQASDFQAGDLIVIRGQNDVNGKALSKQTLHVASVDVGLNNLNLAEELEESYATTYPLSDWEPDHTTGTTLALAAYAALTRDGAPNDAAVRVNRTQFDSSGMVVGSVVLLATNETEADINSHAHTSGGTPYKNAARLEIKRITSIVAVDSTHSDIWFDSPLIDTYATARFAGITLYNPITNSHIINPRITYSADQTSRNTHGVQIGYGYKSTVVGAEVNGAGGQKGNGIRLSNSLDCKAIRCRVSNPKFSGSSEGYGMACYYADRCEFLDCIAEGCRHNFLAQKANGTFYGFCTSINDLISGFDLHGVRSFNTHFLGCRGFGGPGIDSDSDDHKSIFRVGNTSHACGDFNTHIEGCFVTGAKATIVGNGTTSNGNPTITSINTTGFRVGAAISGTGIPGSTTILSFTETTVTMSANASASATVAVTVSLFNTYAALEVFGASADVTMTGCFVSNCHTGIRGGYDNLSGSGENDDALRICVHGNIWNNVTVLSDLKSSGSVTGLCSGGLTVVAGTTASGATFSSVITTTSAPDISAGDQLVATTYTPYASPNRKVMVRCVLPYMSTGTATCAVMTLWAGSTCIGTNIRRIQTTGANSGTDMECTGEFTPTSNAPVTIQCRFGVNAAATLTVCDRFSSNATQKPKLYITEMP